MRASGWLSCQLSRRSVLAEAAVSDCEDAPYALCVQNLVQALPKRSCLLQSICHGPQQGRAAVGAAGPRGRLGTVAQLFKPGHPGRH